MHAHARASVAESAGIVTVPRRSMSMAGQYFPLLDTPDEDALHYARLLQVEERQYTRISKRLLDRNAMTRRFPTQLPTPPPDATNDDPATSTLESDSAKARVNLDRERAEWRDDLLLDFEAFESGLIRMQLLKNTNERERERYAAEKSKILETAQSVKEATAESRTQLVEAQRTLALRKEYDELADKITSNRMLKPRDEQAAALEKLNTEIAELVAEGSEYGNLWAERSTQFTKIVDEGNAMVRLIRGEKDAEDKDESELRDDEDPMKLEDSRTGTPRAEAGGATPMRDGDEPVSGGQSKLLQRAVGLGGRTPIPGSSRGASPAPNETDDTTPGASKDTDMAEAEAGTQEAPSADELEEGETADDSMEVGEQMDVT